MATTVKITEMYDLKTTVGRMGIIGIHTPQLSQVNKMYPGLIKNHKFVRFKKCDVAGACASVLPADPLQVGVTAGAVAPEDMFNPILMKAVTNESFDTLVTSIYKNPNVSGLGSVSEGKSNVEWTEEQVFKMYYSLLAQNGKFRKVMPQSGFSLRNLVPICHTLISTYGNTTQQGNITVLGEDGETPKFVPNVAETGETDLSTFAKTIGHDAITLRGKSVRMPRLPLHYATEAWDSSTYPPVPETFVACIIVPPAKLHEFYYRMRVTWTLVFDTVISSTDVGNFGAFQDVGGLSHGTNYTFSSSKSDLENKESSVDADGVEINKILES